jgi:hypothetical protein
MLAGTAIPDWLSVADRRVRMRSRRIRPQLEQLDADSRLVALGTLQHLADDDLFHNSATFLMLEADMTGRFRRQIPDRFDHRPAFLGHITVELLLDWYIYREQSGILDRWYDAMQSVCPQQIQAVVNLLAPQPTDQLAPFIRRFLEARGMYDYADDSRLLTRLNQVLRRVTLEPLDECFLSVLREGRQLLTEFGASLLLAVECESAGRAG